MQGKKVIATSFDNVLLNQTPVHAYAAFRAYKALVEKREVRDGSKFQYRGFFKDEIKPENFVSASPLLKSFFFVAFDKLRHLAHGEEDYLKIIMLIEKNKEYAVMLQSSENSWVYRMFKQSVLDQPVELGRDFIERISVENASKMLYGTAFRDSIRNLSKVNEPMLMKMYVTDEVVLAQLRKMLEHFPIYFATMRDPRFVRPVLEGLFQAGCLVKEDFKHLDIKALANASTMNWGGNPGKNYLFSDSNILTSATHGIDLPRMLAIATAREDVQKSDVWFLTTKFKRETVKELFEAGYVRENPRKDGGMPLVNMFIIAGRQPFAGQYDEEIATGAVVLEHDRFAEKLVALAFR